MDVPERIAGPALKRAQDSKDDRRRFLEMLFYAQGVRGESDPAHKLRMLDDKFGIHPALAEVALRDGLAPVPGLSPKQICELRRVFATNDLKPVAFLEMARRAANAVGRFVAKPNGDTGRGTFFMISPELLITNNHVVKDEDVARQRYASFNSETEEDGTTRRPETRFRLDPGKFFVTEPSDVLDFTVVAVGDLVAGKEVDLSSFGYCPIAKNRNALSPDVFVNVIQHPGGRTKKIAIRENRLFCLASTVMQYYSDTIPGSSGAPLFDDRWRVVGIHHWGATLENITLANGVTIPDEVNEGIAATAIVEALERRLPTLPQAQQDLLNRALAG